MWDAGRTALGRLRQGSTFRVAVPTTGPSHAMFRAAVRSFQALRL